MVLHGAGSRRERMAEEFAVGTRHAPQHQLTQLPDLTLWEARDTIKCRVNDARGVMNRRVSRHGA